MKKQKVSKFGALVYTVSVPVDKPGKDTRWVEVGVAYGNQGKDKDAIKITVDVLPVEGWNGTLYLFPSYE